MSAADDAIRTATEALRADRALSHPRLREAAAHLQANRPGAAAALLQQHLKAQPRDARALHLLAESAARSGQLAQAEAMLAQCVALAPQSEAARFAYANILIRVAKPEAALGEAATLLAREPRNPLFRRLEALALEAMDDFTAAAEIWRGLLKDYPSRPDILMRYGHALRALGEREPAVAAYRKATELVPGFGGAWWSLADMKSLRFRDDEVAQMQRQLARADLKPEDRTQIHFALGKAHDDRAQYEQAFQNYARGNALHRQSIHHDPEMLTAYVARCRALFTADLFADRAGAGAQSAEPIFLVGMARSGSTLVEQILASHSAIEGTRELVNLAALSHEIQTALAPKLGVSYPEILGRLDGATLTGLGERYLAGVRAHRKLGKPHFTDKMGANFVHVGLMRLILPDAKIVDVRRHPMAAGFSIFAQHFPRGQNDSYRLSEIGRVWRDYAALMAHFDTVLPGKVHRVFYERLVAEPEAEVRRLLAYLGLPFEPQCVEFHKTERVVTTASSEQVRTPLYANALEHWRHYERWLAPLKDALGPALETYPHQR